MTKGKHWIEEVTPTIKEQMLETVEASYKNGLDLRQEATLLFEAGRFSRAAALAILAEEEFSKAYILKVTAEGNRWDSELFKGLRKHTIKQGISVAMTGHFIEYINQHELTERINQNNMIFFKYPPMKTDQASVERLSEKMQHYMSDSTKEKLKQKSFYTDFDNSAKLVSVPSDIGEEDARQALDDSFLFQIVVEVASSGNVINLDKYINEKRTSQTS